MKRSLWLNALLLVAVAGLGLFVYLRPKSDAPAEHALSALKPEEVGSIRIEREGAAAVVLERKQDAWFLVAPLAARADDFAVQRLLAIVQAKAAHRLAATDLARFDLERPPARLIIGGQSFGFGVVSEVAREQYVLTGDAVYAVNPRYGMALPGNAAALISRRLLAPGEVPVRIEVSGFSVTQRDGRWVLAPAPGEPSQDDLNRWVDDWRLATAIRVEPYAKGKPRGEIKLELENSGKLALGILGREPELVLLRPDEKLQYHFLAEIANRLLSPPGAANK
ncbi:MAG: DUF4340 domain-containing protein [Betaproteobacteria bacterium]|nr:DUF4340 domain-containing protein [Betaproteobacteria bacterium]